MTVFTKPEIDSRDAVDRLEDFGIKTALAEGHVRQACIIVSQSGAKWEREDDKDPEAVLDATALLAHYVSLDPRHTTPVISESVMQARQSYSERSPKMHPSYLAAERLLMEYGGRLSAQLA